MTDLWSRRPAEVAEDPTAEDRRFNYMVEQAIRFFSMPSAK